MDFSERFVDFEGAFNVRDLGGVATTDGAMVRTGRVFRADSPGFLTDSDRERIGELDLGHVLDLRSGTEADEGTWAVGEMTRHLFEVIDPAQHPSVAPDSAQVPAIADHESFAQRYVMRLENGADTFVAAAKLLTDSIDDGVLFHCTAGKDRTGLLAAFVLSAIGVDRDIIVADYAASDEPMQRKFAWHQENDDASELAEQMARVSPMLLRAPAPVMERTLELLDQQHGGIVGFFDANGFGADEVDRLQQRLLT